MSPQPKSTSTSKKRGKGVVKPLTKEAFGRLVKERVDRIAREFTEGFKFIEGLERSVTFFGSARSKSNDLHYKQARELGARLAKRGIAVITGGSAGIMEAGNRGAKEANGFSVGLNIELATAQSLNPYLTESMTFNHFFVRKVLLSYAAEAYVFFPGGFGALDEFFEIVTLVQTNKIERVPIILIGADYWTPLHNLIKNNLYEKHATISKKDMHLYKITDDLAEAEKIILKAPIRHQN